jgi:hypothetical protein
VALESVLHECKVGGRAVPALGSTHC